MTPLILIHGTWSRAAAWHRAGSPLWNALEAHGFSVIDFKWSGYTGGVPGIIAAPSENDTAGVLEIWKSEGEKLALFCKVIEVERPCVLSHSHGLQLVAFAAMGSDLVPPQLFATALSLSGPVRLDMTWTRQRAKSNITTWIQVTDPVSDLTIREGEFLDGHVGWQYALPEADVNLAAPGQGHSGLLTDLAAWETLGIWKELGVGEQP